MDLLYAHQRTCVWRMTRRLDGHTGLEYSVRGWPFFETTISQLIKDRNNVLGLGTKKAVRVLKKFEGRTRSIDELVKQASYEWYAFPGVHGELVDLARQPPLLPADFETQMADKTLTNGKDAELVIKLQRKVATAVLGGAKSLDFSNLGWGAAEAQLLAKALPWCPQLQMLKLVNSNIGADGAAALAAVLRENATSCTSLECARRPPANLLLASLWHSVHCECHRRSSTHLRSHVRSRLWVPRARAACSTTALAMQAHGRSARLWRRTRASRSSGAPPTHLLFVRRSLLRRRLLTPPGPSALRTRLRLCALAWQVVQQRHQVGGRAPLGGGSEE